MRRLVVGVALVLIGGITACSKQEVYPAKTRMIWVRLDGVGHYLVYTTDVSSGRVSPLVIQRVHSLGSVYTAVAYHPNEETFYIFSGKDVLLRAGRGMIYVDRDLYWVVDGEFDMPSDLAATESPDDAVLVALVTETFDRCAFALPNEHNQSVQATTAKAAAPDL